MISEEAKRAIVHMDLDSFFVSVERILQPSLANKPVIVGGHNDRGVVSSCSYEARQFGVHSAMPVHMAKKLCPEAIVISGDMEAYGKFSGLVTDIIRDKAPIFEKSSIDEFYIDISGMDKFHGSYKWSKELRETIMKETKLPLSFGLATNKLVAKVSTNEAKPNGHIFTPEKDTLAFLAPLNVGKIPMVGKKTLAYLNDLGLKTIGDVRQIPQEVLLKTMGKAGLQLWQKAHGIDHSPVIPYQDRKSISTEMTFHQDTTAIELLKNTLLHMTEKVAFNLRKENRLTACITVKIRYSNFDTVSKQLQIPHTSSDHLLIPHALQLFEKLYDRRLLIRLIGVRLSKLVHGSHQIDLFNDSEKTTGLYSAMDHIRHKFGDNAIMRAAGKIV